MTETRKRTIFNVIFFSAVIVFATRHYLDVQVREIFGMASPKKAIEVANQLSQSGRGLEALEVVRAARDQWPKDKRLDDEFSRLRKSVVAELEAGRLKELMQDPAQSYKNLESALSSEDENKLGRALSDAALLANSFPNEPKYKKIHGEILAKRDKLLEKQTSK